MSSSSRRTLVQALAVSLLLHAVLLSSAVRLFPARLEVAATSLKAVIRDRGAAAPVPRASPTHSPAALKPSSPQVASVPVVAPPAAAAPAEASVSARSPEDSPSLSSGAAARTGASAVSGAAVGSAPVPSAAPGGGSGSASAGGRQGVGGDDLRQYRLALGLAARRFKQYPALARQRGWEGTVEVALNVSAAAPAPDVVLVRSSGRAVLDEQALEMLSQAARVTALPEGLKARDFRLVLPVQFSLENDQ